MTNSNIADTVAAGPGGGSATAAASSPPAVDRARERERIQRLVDQAASFNLLAIPDSSFAPGRNGGNPGTIQQRLTLHRFDITLDGPSESGVRGVNSVGPKVGTLDIQWTLIPYDFQAIPGRQPPATPLDSGVTQRFVMQEATFTFSGGNDGFRSFGTGRTFPMMAADRPRLVVAAIGVITEGFGRFRGLDGNFSICGELNPERVFSGHVMVRALDQDSVLLGDASVPVGGSGPNGEEDTTYLTWIGQKGEGPDQENQFSIDQQGQVRGLNIPVHLKRVSVAFTVDGGFRAAPLKTDDVVGREVGFGRGSVPGASPSGSSLNPFLFEGVSLYSFYDAVGNTVGTLTANVLEGRRFDVQLKRAPQEPALRFGFFGPIIFGTGCFKGAQGMLYGASGSVFKLPPDIHVISNWYVLRLLDPDGKFRAQ